MGIEMSPFIGRSFRILLFIALKNSVGMVVSAAELYCYMEKKFQSIFKVFSE